MAGSIEQLAAFNQLDQQVNSPGKRAYCYVELVVSCPAVVLIIFNIHFVYPRRDGQAELLWMVWSNMKAVYPRMVTHLHRCYKHSFANKIHKNMCFVLL